MGVGGEAESWWQEGALQRKCWTMTSLGQRWSWWVPLVSESCQDSLKTLDYIWKSTFFMVFLFFWCFSNLLRWRITEVFFLEKHVDQQWVSLRSHTEQCLKWGWGNSCGFWKGFWRTEGSICDCQLLWGLACARLVGWSSATTQWRCQFHHHRLFSIILVNQRPVYWCHWAPHYCQKVWATQRFMWSLWLNCMWGFLQHVITWQDLW